MPDITMCNNELCAQKELCYRFKAKPTPLYQSYFSDDVRTDDGDCNYFLKLYVK